jgi:hypothetical protein
MMRTTQGAERLAEQLESIRHEATQVLPFDDLSRVVVRLATALRDHFRSQVRTSEKVGQLELRNRNGEFVVSFLSPTGEEKSLTVLLGERLFYWDEERCYYVETTPHVVGSR